MVDPMMPYLSAPRILSKAKKDATAWYNRTKELEEADAYHERVRLQLNLPETGVPLKSKEVKIVNVDKIANSVTKGINDNIAPRAAPDPTPPPSRPPSSRGMSAHTDNFAQINPLTREISTTSTQTMREMADALTSAVPTISSGGTQTDVEPMTGGELAMMSVDPPLQQIVNNYVNYHTVNNYLQQHQHDYNAINVVNNNQTTNQVIQNHLHQTAVLQQIEQRPPIHNPIQHDPAEGLLQNQNAITFQNRLMIEAPANQPVPFVLPVLPARNDDCWQKVTLTWILVKHTRLHMTRDQPEEIGAEEWKPLSCPEHLTLHGIRD